jgi:hypothetical protein
MDWRGTASLGSAGLEIGCVERGNHLLVFAARLPVTQKLHALDLDFRVVGLIFTSRATTSAMYSSSGIEAALSS